MARFPNRTQYELSVYFNGLDLDQLKKLNHGYGDHFERLEERLEKIQKQQVFNKQQIESITLKIQKLDEQTPFLAAQDEQYYRTREIIAGTSSRSERYLAYQSLGSSPSEIYSSDLRELNTSLQQALENKEGLSNQVQTIMFAKSRAVSELKLLNRVIDSKNTAALQQIQDQPAYAAN